MRFLELPLRGAFVVEPERIQDDRGFFAATWSVAAASAHGIRVELPESSVAWNAQSGTLRGMHYQARPLVEAKLVTCTSGSIFDVIVDLRDGSPTRFMWHGLRLSSVDRTSLFVPRGFAHGYLTLEDQTEVSYRISDPYRRELARGIRWNDAAIGIDWPAQPQCMNQRDASYEDLRPSEIDV